MSDLPSCDIKKWTTEDVMLWIKSAGKENGFDEYAKYFQGMYF